MTTVAIIHSGKPPAARPVYQAYTANLTPEQLDWLAAGAIALDCTMAEVLRRCVADSQRDVSLDDWQVLRESSGGAP